MHRCIISEAVTSYVVYIEHLYGSSYYCIEKLTADIATIRGIQVTCVCVCVFNRYSINI